MRLETLVVSSGRLCCIKRISNYSLMLESRWRVTMRCIGEYDAANDERGDSYSMCSGPATTSSRGALRREAEE